MSPFLMVALLIRIFANPIANVIQKNLAQQEFASQRINQDTYIFLALVGFIILISGPSQQLEGKFWLYAILTGIFGALGNGLLLKALEIGELSVLGPINSYKSVFAMIIGIFLLKEIPEASKIFGIALIIGGSYFVLGQKTEKFSLRLFNRPDIKYRMWAMILTATEAIFLKKLILLSNVHYTFAVWAIFGSFFAFIFSRMQKKRSITKSVSFNYLTRIILIGIVIVSMQYATIYVFQKIIVVYGLAIFQLSALITVFLGFYYFGEKRVFQKILGSFIMIGGTLIILLL